MEQKVQSCCSLERQRPVIDEVTPLQTQMTPLAHPQNAPTVAQGKQLAITMGKTTDNVSSVIQVNSNPQFNTS